MKKLFLLGLAISSSVFAAHGSKLHCGSDDGKYTFIGAKPALEWVGEVFVDGSPVEFGKLTERGHEGDLYILMSDGVSDAGFQLQLNFDDLTAFLNEVTESGGQSLSDLKCAFKP